jgi:hypothetical protein
LINVILGALLVFAPLVFGHPADAAVNGVVSGAALAANVPGWRTEPAENGRRVAVAGRGRVMVTAALRQKRDNERREREE